MIEFMKKLLSPDTPELMSLSNMPELEVTKNRLVKQMEERERVESRLRKSHFELQKQVEELTAELTKCREFLKHEISERKWDEQLIQDYKAYANCIVENMREPFVILNSEMKVIMANRSFYRTFGQSAEETENRVFFDANDSQWNITNLRKAMEEVLYDKSEPQEIEVAHEFLLLGRKVMRINISRVHRKENSIDMLLLVIEDITAAQEMEANIISLRETIVNLYKKNRLESIISKITQCLHQSINLQEVLDNAVNSIGENIDSADYIAIYMVEGKEAVMKSHKGLPDWAIEELEKITYPRGFIWKAIVEGVQVYCADTENAKGIEPVDKKMDIKSYMYMPLQSEGSTIGAISIKSLQVNPMGDEEINLVETVKKELETSIKNAQQAETLRKADQHYTRTSGKLETRVKTLTEELRKANERIISETRERKRLEEELKSSATELENSKHELENLIYVLSHDLKEPLKKIQASCSHLEEKNGKTLKSDAFKYVKQIDNAVKKMQSPIHDLETRYETVSKNQHGNGNGRDTSLTSPSLKMKKCS